MLPDLRVFAGIPACAAIILGAAAPAQAVKFHFVFGSHMVLQREKPVPVWGESLPGENLTVTCAGQTRSAKGDAAGKWKVVFDPMAAGGPHRLVARGLDSAVLTDVMVGEVWIGGGQSNMEGTLKAMGGDNLDSARKADVPDLRLYTMWGDKTWRRCDSTAALLTSATAFFFAKRVQEQLKIPVGMLVSAVGGTSVEQWIDTATVRADPTFAGDSLAGGGFRAMITPIIPMAIRGVIWYQGESNTAPDSTVRWSYLNYRRRFAQLIPGWRKAWGQGDFPFHFVQLPEHKPLQTVPVEVSSFAEVREGQRLGLLFPHTTQTVTLGLGDPVDIHPNKKAEVGRRLALNALARTYGKTGFIPGGPEYESMAIRGPELRLRFRRADGGLRAIDNGTLKGFTLAGSDGKWHWADATVRGDTVVLTSAQVTAPAKARYAWADNPVFGLTNASGIPASPFRTDGPQLPVPTAVEAAGARYAKVPSRARRLPNLLGRRLPAGPNPE